MGLKFLQDISNLDNIQFINSSGTNAGLINMDGNDLVISNSQGDVLLGDGSADVFIGDGTNNVDIRFEQSGSITADNSNATLTIGGTGNLVVEEPTINNPTFSGAFNLGSKLTLSTSNGYILFDYEPAGDTGEYTTEVPLLKVDHNGTEKTILSRISENGGIQLGHDDSVLITAGDVGDEIKANWGATNENVVLASEAGFYALAFPNNSTTWSNRNIFRFYGGDATAANNGLYIGDGSSTQFIDLDRNISATSVTAGNIKAMGGGNLFVYDDDDNTKIHFFASSNSNEGFLQLSNGSNWGLLARGKGNDPRLGAYHNGYLSIWGFGSNTGADHADDDELARFDFANERLIVNGQISVGGNITTSSNSYIVSSRKFTARDANGTGLFADDAASGLSIADDGDATFTGSVTATNLIGTPVDASTHSLTLGRTDNSNYWNVNHAGNDFRLYNSAGSGSDILFGVNSGGVVQANNVGIGTATPSEKLDVAGNISVSGTVDGIDIAARDAVLTSTTTTANAALPKAGGTMTGSLILDDNSGDSPSIQLKNGSDINYQIYTGSSSLILTRVNNGGADFSFNGSSTDYTNSTLAVGGAEISSTKIGNWNTAYGWGDHASAGYLTSLPSHNHDDRYYTEAESDARYAALSHNHAASAIVTGTLDDGRISESSVTQHEAALTITEGQLPDDMPSDKVKQICTTHHNFFMNSTSTTADFFVPFNNLNESSNPTNAQYYNRMVAPYNGRIVKVVLHTTAAIGTACQVLFWVATSSGTFAPSAAETVTGVNLNAANTSATATFSTNSTAQFSAEDVLGVSIIKSSSTTANMQVTVVWEYTL